MRQEPGAEFDEYRELIVRYVHPQLSEFPRNAILDRYANTPFAELRTRVGANELLAGMMQDISFNADYTLTLKVLHQEAQRGDRDAKAQLDLFQVPRRQLRRSHMTDLVADREATSERLRELHRASRLNVFQLGSLLPPVVRRELRSLFELVSPASWLGSYCHLTLAEIDSGTAPGDLPDRLGPE